MSLKLFPFKKLLPKIDVNQADEQVRSDLACKMIQSGASLSDFNNFDSPLPKLFHGVYSNKFTTAQMLEQYDKASNVLKQSIAHVICRACSDTQEILDWINSEKVAINDKPYYLVALASQGPAARDLVWTYLVDNVEKIDDTEMEIAGILNFRRLFFG